MKIALQLKKKYYEILNVLELLFDQKINIMRFEIYLYERGKRSKL